MLQFSSAAKFIVFARVASAEFACDPEAAPSAGDVADRLTGSTSWIDAAAAIVDRALLVRLIALYGRDDGDLFGLTLARAWGDPRMMRMAAAQILDDFDHGDMDACAFMATQPVAPARRAA